MSSWSDDTSFVAWLAAWVACMAFVLWGQRKNGAGSGLVISYVLQLWVIHWLAAAIYALPWYQAPDGPIRLGLEQSTYAIAGFAVGASLVVPFLRRRYPDISLDDTNRVRADSWLVHTYLIVGIIAYFVIEPLLHPIPTIGAVASATSNLLLVALGMECWNGLRGTVGHRRGSFWRWLVLSACLPFMTIVTKGFLSYGFAAMLTVFSFVAAFYRPRWKIAACGLVIGYLALSMYVTYMRDRREIRSVVWGQESYSARLSASSRMVTDFEVLDLRNVEHLERIDERLNQNALVGISVMYLDIHPELFAKGRTLWEAILSPIPRFLWPTKNISAGSGDLVSEFTGLKFGEDTSVGIGHVMEWYVNFGSPGVFFGMIFIGVVIGWIDRSAIARLHRGDWPGFTLWWLPGISLLQVQGSLVDAVSSAGASLIVAALIQRYRPARTPELVTPQAPKPRTRMRSHAAVSRGVS
jgi:hypothetical protein